MKKTSSSMFISFNGFESLRPNCFHVFAATTLICCTLCRFGVQSETSLGFGRTIMHSSSAGISAWISHKPFAKHQRFQREAKVKTHEHSDEYFEKLESRANNVLSLSDHHAHHDDDEHDDSRQRHRATSASDESAERASSPRPKKPSNKSQRREKHPSKSNKGDDDDKNGRPKASQTARTQNNQNMQVLAFSSGESLVLHTHDSPRDRDAHLAALMPLHDDHWQQSHDNDNNLSSAHSSSSRMRSPHTTRFRDDAHAQSWHDDTDRNAASSASKANPNQRQHLLAFTSRESLVLHVNHAPHEQQQIDGHQALSSATANNNNDAPLFMQDNDSNIAHTSQSQQPSSRQQQQRRLPTHYRRTFDRWQN